MKNNLNRNQWIAVVCSLVVALFIVFFSFKTAPQNLVKNETNTDNKSDGTVKNNISNTTNNTNTMTFEKIINDGDSYTDIKELKIKTVKEGAGASATVGKTVVVNYAGFLTDGTKFDSSFDRNQPFSFTLGNRTVIEGWEKGILDMKIGETRKLVIPSSLAYGASGVGSIPPNATLIFVVDLLEVK